MNRGDHSVTQAVATCAESPAPTTMADWRADPTPYPLRKDTAPRAVYPEGVKA